jgi:hypothetical protein
MCTFWANVGLVHHFLFAGQQITFNYTAYNESGAVIDTTYTKDRPATIRLGIGGMIPGIRPRPETRDPDPRPETQTRNLRHRPGTQTRNLRPRPKTQTQDPDPDPDKDPDPTPETQSRNVDLRPRPRPETQTRDLDLRPRPKTQETDPRSRPKT